MVNARDSTPSDEETARAYRSWEQYDSSDSDDGFGLDSAFKDLIQRDPTVCDNCFLKKYTRVTHEWWRGSLGWMDYERWVPFPERVEEIPAEGTQGTRLTCGNCGHRSTKHRPVPKEDIVEHAENISDTLRRKHISHDRELLISEVLQRNTSDNQGKQDSDVFAPAVKRAIEATKL